MICFFKNILLYNVQRFFRYSPAVIFVFVYSCCFFFLLLLVLVTIIGFVDEHVYSCMDFCLHYLHDRSFIYSFKIIVAQKSAHAYNAQKCIVYEYIVLIALWSSYFHVLLIFQWLSFCLVFCWKV